MSTKAERAQRLARDLGLTLDELRFLRRQVTAAESNLIGVAGKANVVAQRLSLTPAEVKTLRLALAPEGVAKTQTARLLARHVLGLPEIRATLPFGQRTLGAPARPNASVVSAPPSPAPRTGVRTVGGRSFARNWSADTNVYVTPLGDAVHQYSNCHGMRGFRHVEEADPVIHQVRLRDPVCAERRACRKCFDMWSPSVLDHFDHFLEGLHGTRQSSYGPRHVASPRRVVPRLANGTSRRAPQARPTTTLKADRDSAAAAKLGLSVEQLKARRRAEHEENRRKKLG